jgi:predicted methyltransferase
MSSLSTKGQPASFSSAQQLAGYLLDQTSPDHNVAAIEHRQRLVQAWNIPLGSKILEIGCGQGDSTVVLADAVGPTGRVVAVDSCPPGWGMRFVFPLAL